MIHIAICDDELTHLNILYNQTYDFIAKHQVYSTIRTYQNSQFLLYDVQESTHFDLLILNIEMPNLNGIHLAFQIKQQLPGIIIIFVASHLNYAIDAFKLSIFRYILKNNLDSHLHHALTDALHLIHMQANEFYLIHTQNRMQKIFYKDITYIKKDGKNCVLTTYQNSISKVRKSLGQVYSEIKSEDFIFIDRGCILNIAHVMSIQNRDVALKNGTILQISHSHLGEIKKTLNQFWG